MWLKAAHDIIQQHAMCCNCAADSPSDTTIVTGAVARKPPSPSSDKVTVQLVLPDLVAAGVKLSTPDAEMAGGTENSALGLHRMLIASS
jgi:hypothetical protein